MISIELTRLHIALILYILFIMLVLVSRPAFMFTSDGRLKRWGIENDEETNMFAFGFVIPIVGVLMYIFATWLDLIIYRP